MKKNVTVAELQFGMYVTELDRPWSDTPLISRGFVLQTEEQRQVLMKFCKSVFVDEELSEPQAPPSTKRSTPPRSIQVPREREAEPAKSVPAPPEPAVQPAKSVQPPPAPAVRAESVPVPLEREVERAKVAHIAAQATVQEMMLALRANKALDAKSVAQAVSSMTESVLRNPDAVTLYSQLREKGDYTHSHALDVALYMTMFGRFLQLPAEEVSLLGYLGLMQDVGKLRVPNEILTKRDRLAPQEADLAKGHVQHSVDILNATTGLPPRLAELAALHHERQDGSGYPRGLKGKDIGMIGSIAAIADTFDALTASRPYAQAVSPTTALSMLYKWRGTFFDEVLVEQFIRCIGIFPLGSVVELNSGEVGIVIAQNTEKRLQPRVIVIRDAAGQQLKPQKLLDLAREPKVPAGGEVYRIMRTLEYGKAGINAEALLMS